MVGPVAPVRKYESFALGDPVGERGLEGPSRLHLQILMLPPFPTHPPPPVRDQTSRQGLFLCTREWATGLDYRGALGRADLGSTEEGVRELCPMVGNYMIEACPPLMSSFSLPFLPQTLFTEPQFLPTFPSLCCFLRVQSHSLLCSRFPFHLAAI